MLIRRHPAEIVQLLPKRLKESHKGTYGKLMIVAGSNRYTGAASLMVEAALRSGVGLVVVVCTHLTAQVIRVRAPEAIVVDAPELNGGFDRKAIKVIEDTVLEYGISTIGIGPGLGKLTDEQGFYGDLLKIFKTNDCNVVVDADALAPMYQLVKDNHYIDERMVFTPHPKEFKEMVNKDELSNENKVLLEAAKDIKQIIVYKTHETIIGSSGGIWKSSTGSQALATAGSGDVLAGIIAGLIAQKVPPQHAAMLGVYIHGLTGEIAMQSMGLRSVLARDICNCIGDAFLAVGHNNG